MIMVVKPKTGSGKTPHITKHLCDMDTLKRINNHYNKWQVYNPNMTKNDLTKLLG